ncbi:MAG: hypothetical protein RMH84_01260 [Sulfolobales archaeon]|nr:hypothetical protein [Sulfolobales archaeon]MCX8208039.1 hypothetical protein [Sulfolobales archaeon]MDW8010214.1 hypothetical protein [Sulfolobales archaeon]
MRSAEAVLCSSCGRRSASYYRRHSGEKLCAICLYRDLAREIKRSFSLIRKKSFGLKIAVLVYSHRIVESTVLMKILSDIERGFNSEVVCVVLEEELFECYSVFRRYCQDVVFSSLGRDVLEGGYVQKAIAGLTTRLDVVALPETLNDILTLFLKNLVNKYVIEKPRIYFKSGDVEVVVPMYRVLKTDVTAYAHISGILKSLDCFNTSVGNVEVLEKLAVWLSLKHPELVYRFLRNVET